MARVTELVGVRDDLSRDPVVLTAPTPEAARVVHLLAVEPTVAEGVLAPTTTPRADRGHLLDALVRRHALDDRFRDVVVVSDGVTSTLLLRALAPDQAPAGGAVTVVGLPRGERPIAVRRAVVLGLVLGLAAGVLEPLTVLVALPVTVALVGATLLVGPSRHLGRELLLVAAITVIVTLAVLAGSARFPGAW